MIHYKYPNVNASFAIKMAVFVEIQPFSSHFTLYFKA